MADVALSSHQEYRLNVPPREIWRSLSQEEQIEAVECFFRGGGENDSLVGRLSRRLKFRPAAFKRQPFSWRVEKLVRYVLTDELASELPHILRAFHLEARANLLCDFLDAAGISHTGGSVDPEAAPPGPDAIMRGLNRVLESHPPFQVLTYLRTLLAVDESADEMWASVPDAAAAVFRTVQQVDQRKAGEAVAVEGRDPDDDDVESTDEFTTLDELLVKTIVAAALNIEGALEPAKLDDITDELLHLNANRKRSFFHRGFLKAIFNVDEALSEAGENQESRLWFVAGLMMGWMRKGQPDRCIEYFQKTPKALEQIAQDTNPFRVRMLLPALYPILQRAGRHQAVAAYVKQGLSHLNSSRARNLVAQIIEDASNLLREGDASSAFLLLQSVSESSPMSGFENFAEASELVRKLARKKAQCLQAQGQFPAAEAQLRKLAEVGDYEESIKALADLGLILGGFRSLYAILPAREEAAQHSNAEALQRGVPYFEEAITRAPGGVQARNSYFSLGVFFCTSKDPDPIAASKHLSLALVGMMETPESYEVGSLLVWARFLLGLSILETCEVTALRTATDSLQDALKSGISFPRTLWARCIRAAALFDDKTLALELAQHLWRIHGNKALRLMRQTGILQDSPELLTRYAEWIHQAHQSLAAEFEEWRFVLVQALSNEQLELAERTLDELERIAHGCDEFTDGFLGILKNSSGYSPAWEPLDADEARVKLLEVRGRLDEAADLLQKRFWQLRAERSAEARAEAEGVLFRLEEIGRPERELEVLRDSLPERDSDAGASAIEIDTIDRALRDGDEVRILFVGGDEKEAKLDASIRSGITQQYPGVRVRFEHPGWGTKWVGIADQIEAHLRDYDAVVLSPLVRTNMGRRMRKICDEQTPWFACPGRGAEFIRRSIAQAAHSVLRLRKASPKI